MKPFDFKEKQGPIVVSIPHAGTYVPEYLYKKLTPTGRAMNDTDWFVDRLFSFVRGMDISFLSANYSRTFIDLNRSPDDKALYGNDTLTTGLCPTISFTGEPLYEKGCEPDALELGVRMERVWKPYHQTLEAALAKRVKAHGYAILLDLHSIKSLLPKLFDGHLPHLNFGTNDGNSASAELIAGLLEHVRENSNYQTTLNDRFKGGYITRHYGHPQKGVHAIQLEMAQKIYMDEDDSITSELRFDTSKALTLQPMLKEMIEVLVHAHDEM